ncbi:hypothetical protein J437_LFUL015774 [Ladona fulva]|uniref:Uncharacterized protein n=1 Tax=Ladona fulva TaxID=123851 RepID=A0A8K0P7C8_LADFU|nr:hypothetical protein J437_LFUL015774 [Ladona fulva]
MDGQSVVIDMLNDLLKALPAEDMKNWFSDVCMKDDDFLNFITIILMVDSPEYEELTQTLDSHGKDINSKRLDDFVRQHSRRLRSLQTLADEFAAFIPIDDVVRIIKSYMQNDDDVKRVFAFLQGDTFRNLIVKLEGLKELKEFFNWLYSRGIDIYSLANAALGFLGMPLIVPPESRMLEQTQRQSGFTHMINDINDILPMDDIKDWYHHVCEEDKEFKDLIKQLKSDSFSVVVKTVKDDPSFNIIHEGLISLGVEVGYLDRFLHESFGW